MNAMTRLLSVVPQHLRDKARNLSRKDGRLRFVTDRGRVTLVRPKLEDVYVTNGSQFGLWFAGHSRATNFQDYDE